MKIIFAGTPEFAASALAALIEAGHEIVLVLTQPDRPAGRGMKLTPSPVKQLALQHGLPVYQPEKLRTPEAQAPVAAADAELMVVAAYGIILPQTVLDMPRLGCVNIHASLLPRWRGAAPIHRAIQAGDGLTGITIMQMDAGLDTGDMLSIHEVAIAEDETTSSLHDKLAICGGKAIVEALVDLPLLQAKATKQPDVGVTYADKIRKDEAPINWQSSADEISRQIRAFNPFPGATSVLNGEVIKIWKAEVLRAAGQPGMVLSADKTGIVVACGEDALRLTELQRPGGRRISASDFIAGTQLGAGSQFNA